MKNPKIPSIRERRWLRLIFPFFFGKCVVSFVFITIPSLYRSCTAALDELCFGNLLLQRCRLSEICHSETEKWARKWHVIDLYEISIDLFYLTIIEKSIKFGHGNKEGLCYTYPIFWSTVFGQKKERRKRRKRKKSKRAKKIKRKEDKEERSSHACGKR